MGRLRAKGGLSHARRLHRFPRPVFRPPGHPLLQEQDYREAPWTFLVERLSQAQTHLSRLEKVFADLGGRVTLRPSMTFLRPRT